MNLYWLSKNINFNSALLFYSSVWIYNFIHNGDMTWRHLKRSDMHECLFYICIFFLHFFLTFYKIMHSEINKKNCLWFSLSVIKWFILWFMFISVHVLTHKGLHSYIGLFYKLFFLSCMWIFWKNISMKKIHKAWECWFPNVNVKMDFFNWHAFCGPYYKVTPLASL